MMQSKSYDMLLRENAVLRKENTKLQNEIERMRGYGIMEKARITVDGLISLWVRLPNSDCQVWDGDELLLSTKNPDPDQTIGEINRIGSMEAKGFWWAHDDNNTLVIRVD